MRPAVDPVSPRLYSDPMATDASKEPIEEEFRRLEQRVAELVDLCARLKDENRVLRGRIDTLSGERAQLLQRSEMARNRVESIVSRLRGMEHG